MSVRRVAFYDKVTGIFSGRTFFCASHVLDKHLELNTPEGCAAMIGDFDRLSQRVDIATGEVIDYQPLQPDADHEWHPIVKRWVKRMDVAEREIRRREAQAQLEALELKQLRRVLEVLAESDPKIKAAVDQIAQLRRGLT